MIFQPSSAHRQDFARSFFQIRGEEVAPPHVSQEVHVVEEPMGVVSVSGRDSGPFQATGPLLAGSIVPTVFIIEDCFSGQDNLESLIRAFGWRVETCVSAEDFLSRPRAFGPSCLVLNVTWHGLKGLELQRHVASDWPTMPIILITGCGELLMTIRAVKSDIAEFALTPLADEGLLSTIRRSIEWSRMTLLQEAEIRALRGRYETLSRREREVMALVVNGLLNKQVAAQLDISEITVKAHRGRVMQKMKAASLADLVKKSVVLRSDQPSGSLASAH